MKDGLQEGMAGTAPHREPTDAQWETSVQPALAVDRGCPRPATPVARPAERFPGARISPSRPELLPRLCPFSEAAGMTLSCTVFGFLPVACPGRQGSGACAGSSFRLGPQGPSLSMTPSENLLFLPLDSPTSSPSDTFLDRLRRPPPGRSSGGGGRSATLTFLQKSHSQWA